MRKALESLLPERWSNYRKALRRCRSKFSEKSVHALRVEIRRVLSTLMLLEAVLPGKHSLPIRNALEDQLKAFSRLHDTQVQLILVKSMATKNNPSLKEFRQFLRRKERRLVKRLARESREARLGRLTRRVNKLGRVLEQSVAAVSRPGRVEAALRGAIVRAFERVSARYRKVDAANTATIHRLRVALKKFRYMVESFAQFSLGVGTRQLRAMHDYQTRMGDIQDVELLLVRAKKFARKRGPVRDAREPFREELLRRRARLVERFLATKDQLWEFWTWPPAPAAAGRKAHAGR